MEDGDEKKSESRYLASYTDSIFLNYHLCKAFVLMTVRPSIGMFWTVVWRKSLLFRLLQRDAEKAQKIVRKASILNHFYIFDYYLWKDIGGF